MKISYDPDVDALRVQLNSMVAVDSDEMYPGVIVDFSNDRQIVGIEILDLSKQKDVEVSAPSLTALIEIVTDLQPTLNNFPWPQLARVG